MVSRFRQQLAYALVAGHGLGMFVLFGAPLQMFLLVLAHKHPGAALLAGGLMVAGFAGVLVFPPPWLRLSASGVSRPAASRGALRLLRMFVGNGDVVQAVARRIDPGWQNSHAGRTPQQTLRWLESMERVHWAALAASIAPITAAFYYGYYLFGAVYVAANLLYNIAPNLVIRDTRRRLMRVVQRRATVEGAQSHQV